MKMKELICIFFMFLVNQNCKAQKKINCQDLNINDLFSIVDTTITYKIVPMADSWNDSNAFLQFKKNGEIRYLSKTDYNNDIVVVPSAYRRGKFYVDKKNKHLIINEYFKNPQGGGWIKKILVEKTDGILFFRFENSCSKSIKLVPLN